jgi:hypothetical protein
MAAASVVPVPAPATALQWFYVSGAGIAIEASDLQSAAHRFTEIWRETHEDFPLEDHSCWRSLHWPTSAYLYGGFTLIPCNSEQGACYQIRFRIQRGTAFANLGFEVSHATPEMQMHVWGDHVWDDHAPFTHPMPMSEWAFVWAMNHLQSTSVDREIRTELQRCLPVLTDQQRRRLHYLLHEDLAPLDEADPIICELARLI